MNPSATLNPKLSDLLALDLCALHARLHAALIDRFVRFIATLTALDLPATLRDWHAFLDAFHAHVHAEEGTIFPACAHLPLPPKASLTLLDHDHALITQTIHRIDALLTSLSATPPSEQRMLLARNLDPLVRLLRALEHHGQREDELFYPAAAQHLPPDQLQRLADTLRASAS
jgi:hypothetical protein